MGIVYTKHAEEKLGRKDIRKFKVTKRMIKKALENPISKTRTKYGDLASVSKLDEGHDLRIIYDIIDNNTKVITFHISRKGRYR